MRSFYSFQERSEEVLAKLHEAILLLHKELELMEHFSHACIAPFEETASLLDRMVDIIHRIRQSFCLLEKAVYNSRELVLAEFRGPRSVRLYRVELCCIEEEIHVLIDAITAACRVMQQFDSVAEYRCRQKWLGGTSEFFSRDAICYSRDLCLFFEKDYHPEIVEMISKIDKIVYELEEIENLKF